MLQFVSSIAHTNPLSSVMEDEERFPDDDFTFDDDRDNFVGGTIDLPMSPPITPPLAPQDEETSPSLRELSPFSTTTSMTSVDSTESIGILTIKLRLDRADGPPDLQDTTGRRLAECTLPLWAMQQIYSKEVKFYMHSTGWRSSRFTSRSCRDATSL